jgi:acid stress chaperone HdeA
MKRSAGALISGLVAGALLVGCSPAATGGNTTCKDFNAADQQTQNDAVAKMLKDEKGSDAVQLEINGTRLAVVAFCQTVGKPDSEIKETPRL